MKNFYFTYKPGHRNYGGWVRVIAIGWRQAMEEYEYYYGRDYLNFFEESIFFKHKPSYPRGELQVI
jgi:hypothetical protein